MAKFIFTTIKLVHVSIQSVFSVNVPLHISMHMYMCVLCVHVHACVYVCVHTLCVLWLNAQKQKHHSWLMQVVYLDPDKYVSHLRWTHGHILTRVSGWGERVMWEGDKVWGVVEWRVEVADQRCTHLPHEQVHGILVHVCVYACAKKKESTVSWCPFNGHGYATAIQWVWVMAYYIPTTAVAHNYMQE